MAGCRKQIVNGIPGKSIWINVFVATQSCSGINSPGRLSMLRKDYKPVHNRGRAALRGPREAPRVSEGFQPLRFAARDKQSIESLLSNQRSKGLKSPMRTIALLTISNIFMTFAWYGHLKYREVPLYKVIFVSWLIAFFEYCFQVPANRIGSYE
ncbi:MAG: DMT family protein, partial [Candidatus Sulfotelmatobacter sp.]